MRARADQAHVAAQHVRELRQFVQGPAPQETADGCDARIVGDLHHRFIQCAGLAEFFLLRVRVGIHGAEFPHPKQPASRAGAWLPEEDRTTGGERDRRGDDGDHRGQDDQCDGRTSDVEDALERALTQPQAHLVQVHERQTGGHAQAESGAGNRTEGGAQQQIDAAALDAPTDLADVRALQSAGPGERDATDVLLVDGGHELVEPGFALTIGGGRGDAVHRRHHQVAGPRSLSQGFADVLLVVGIADHDGGLQFLPAVAAREDPAAP